MEDDSRGPAGGSFEKELANLERVVNLLERGDLDLDAAIREYEVGYRSLKKCHDILEQAQKKIELLTGTAERPATGNDSTPSWSPFALPPALHPPGEPGAGGRAAEEGVEPGAAGPRPATGTERESPEAINSKE